MPPVSSAFCSVLLPAGRLLAAASVLWLSACATPQPQPPVKAAAAQPATAVAREPTEPAPAAPLLAAPAAWPREGSSDAPAPSLGAAASAAEPVLEPVHATPADRTPGAARVFARGTASWYGQRFHGRRTASGERFDMNGLTAAHRTLPFGTRVRVRSVATGREVVVRINDRGPAHRQRIIDLSLGAARALGVKGEGTMEVQLLRE